jgi:tetratricopeptide (TPR) repeat protein
MSNSSAKLFPFYSIALAFFLSLPVFSLQGQTTATEQQARVYRQEGLQLQKDGNIDEAIACFQKALIMDQKYVAAYNDLGVLLEAKGELQQAKFMYLKAMELAPEYAGTYSNLALLCEEQKDYAHAILYWIKRATLGGSDDPWAEIARKRLEDIARLYPEAYRDIGEQYKQGLEQLVPIESASVAAQPRIVSKKDAALIKKEEQDPKAGARDHLKNAQESFSKGDYVTALKEATLAEYLDSSNKEISDFIDKVRKAILH